MIVIGLTGGIGMGKSTTAQMFADEGIPVWDADAAVHRLYRPGGPAIEPVSDRFPGVLDENGGVDRAALSAAVVGNPEALKDLEAIVHPLVWADRGGFLADHREKETPAVLLDIPLLLEGGGKDQADLVVVCSAPEEVRRARVLERPGMTAEKYEAIVARQMPDAEKRAFADFIVPTGEGLEVARQAVAGIVTEVRRRALDAGAEHDQD